MTRLTERDMNDEQWNARTLCRWPQLFALLDSLDLRLSPRRCATLLGLKSKAELERELRIRRLPRFRLLRDWWYLLRIHERAQRSSLARLAASRGDYPFVLYRFVERTAGKGWREVSLLERDALREAALRAWTVSVLKDPLCD